MPGYKDPCPACGDSKVIRVVLKHSMAVTAFERLSNPICSNRDDVRSYPCPECSMRDYVPIERLWTMEEFIAYDVAAQEWGGQEFEEHVRRRLAQGMARQVLEAGVLSYEDGPMRHDRYPPTRDRRATLSVVPARFTKRLEDRVRERQTLVAERAVEAASAEINAWGGDTSKLSKSEAIYIIRQAVKKAIDNFFSRKASDR